ncbi:MAG TPA: S41 family peptidase [Gemmatimonadaceae bacterium]
MRRSRTATVAALALVPLLAGGFLLQERGTRDGARLLDQVMLLVGDRFVDTLSNGQLYERAAEGLVEGLNDPYSDLLTPKELQGFTRTTGGRYGGVGMLIEDQNGRITISRVFPNTPAEQAGIMEGDRIVRVDTASTDGWKLNQVSEALIGTPGTKVNVTFARPGVAKPIEVRFTRAVIHVPAVPYALLLDGQRGGKVGYVPLQQINETAAEELQLQIARLAREGATGLVLDLRQNGGGILDQALEISNLFLDKGQSIVTVRGRTGRGETHVARTRALVPKDLPVVVLTDEYTASASEIVAGALQDHDRALIVGTTSFGKGLVQTVFPLDGGFALKLTTAKWYTPSGRSIQKERKFVNGQFVDEPRDSIETDSVKKERPVYKSDAGRTVYGGGAITPDVIVDDDTLSTAEQAFVKTIAPQIQQVYVTLAEFAQDLKPTVAPNFTVTAAMRDQFYQRLVKAGVKVERAEYDAAQPYVDRTIRYRVARAAFGDSTAKRITVPTDVQLTRAIELLGQTRTQRDLFTIASALRASEARAEGQSAAAAPRR